MTEPANRLPADAPHGLAGTGIDRGKPLRFRLDGRLVHGFAGDSVLSAALAAGILSAGRHGDVPLALDERFAPPVTLDRGNAREALPMDRTPALDGVDLVTLGQRRDLIGSRGILGGLRHMLAGPARSLNHRFGDGAVDLAPWRLAVPVEQLAADVVVVGAGVAGLAAAGAASALGKSVILIERGPAPGGAVGFFGAVDADESPDATLARLTAGLAGKGSVTTFTAAEAFAMDGNEVRVHQVTVEAGVPRARVVAITGRLVVLATGALERLPVFPGNRSPGIVGALAAHHRAHRHGVWVGRRTLLNTPHSAAYRLALHARDAGIELQRIVDTRINPHSRFVDFCKALGVTHGSGLIASQAEPLGRNQPGLRVGFAVAIDDIVQDGGTLETDQLIAAGGWQPDLTLWLSAGGAAAWDKERHWLAPRGSRPGLAVVGAAAGLRRTGAAIASGRAAVLAHFGKTAPIVEDNEIEAIYETPDAPTPIAPVRATARGAAYLDRGATLITRRAAAAGKQGVSQLVANPVALGLGDIAAAVDLGAMAPRDAGIVAAERAPSGGDILDLGWQLPPPPQATNAVLAPPPYLFGRFGPKPQSSVVTSADARFFETGCLIFASSDTTDPREAVGVIYGPAPGRRSGGMALIGKVAPEATLFARDSSGAVAIHVMERLKAAKPSS